IHPDVLRRDGAAPARGSGAPSSTSAGRGSLTSRLLARTLFVLMTFASALAAQRRPALDSAAINDIARLLLLEDVRRFDAPELSRLLESNHPDVRRRAMLAVARIRDPRGVALLRAHPLDRDTALAATTVFAVGQLHDTLTIAWFDSLLSNSRTA